jgi:hypothetical protein
VEGRRLKKAGQTRGKPRTIAADIGSD